MDSHFTEEEVQNTIQSLKRNKSCGLDGLPAEVLKSQSSVLCHSLYILFNYLLNGGEFPVNGLQV